MEATTGMRMAGKISTAVREIANTPPRKITIARTMNVYGRCSATLTIHISGATPGASAGGLPGSGARALHPWTWGFRISAGGAGLVGRPGGHADRGAVLVLALRQFDLHGCMLD